MRGLISHAPDSEQFTSAPRSPGFPPVLGDLDLMLQIHGTGRIDPTAESSQKAWCADPTLRLAEHQPNALVPSNWDCSGCVIVLSWNGRK